jgi:exopolyphosphatase/guanosine-5'-triphosphate,3'-diphosphate pyrophosphatase
MKYASIDIGTNTVLMLVADVDTRLFIRRIADLCELPRLGKSVSQTGELDKEAIERTMNVLSRYVKSATDYGVDKILAFATSAVREAKNGEKFVRSVREKYGIEVAVITGEEEAELGYYGAVSSADDKLAPTLVIDIGGGSTEISFGKKGRPLLVKSLRIGAVRLTEKFFAKVPPGETEVYQAELWTKEQLEDFPFPKVRADQAFATSGTATTLALIAQGIREFDIEAVEDFNLSYSVVCEIYERLEHSTPAQILSMTRAAEGRADVLFAGVLILKQIMSMAHLDSVRVTDRGIRYGFLFRNALKISN